MKRLIAAAVITAIMAGSLLGCGAGQAKEPASQDMAQSEAVQEQAEPSQEQTEAAPEETAQAQPAAGQEETAQAKEAESDVVRPVYKLQSHSRMEEKDLTLIASGSYDTVRLTEEAAMNNVYLNKAIEIENDLIAERYEKSFAEVKEAAENAIAEQREDTEEFPVGNMEGKIIPVRCDQTVLSFYEVSSVYYPGAAHGSIGYSGYNYNPENGAQITLAEVFTDPAALKPVVAKYLRAQADGSPVDGAEDMLQYYFDEGNMDALTWVIDQDGVTFLFAPSDIAPYAMGTLEAKIYFDREPSLFTGNYGSSKEGYVKPMSPYTELTVFAIKDNVPSLLGKMDGTGFASAFHPEYVDGEYSLEQSFSERYPLIDPSKFALGTRMQLMSTYSGHRFYKAGEDGMPAPLTDSYEIDADITLTTLVPVKAEVVDLSKEEATGEEKEIPAGTKLNFWRTNGTDTVDMRTDDMEVGEAFRFKVETSDGQIVNGIKLDEAFDGTMFGG